MNPLYDTLIADSEAHLEARHLLNILPNAEYIKSISI